MLKNYYFYTMLLDEDYSVFEEVGIAGNIQINFALRFI